MSNLADLIQLAPDTDEDDIVVHRNSTDPDAFTNPFLSPRQPSQPPGTSPGAPEFDKNPFHPSPVPSPHPSAAENPFLRPQSDPDTSPTKPREVSYEHYSLEESLALSPVHRAAEALSHASLQPPSPVNGRSPSPQTLVEAAPATDLARSSSADLYHSKEATIADVIERQRVTAELVAETQQHLSMLLAKQQALQQMQQHMEQQMVLSSLQQHQGQQQGRPVTALLAFRCLHHWGAFTDERKNALVTQVSDTLQQHLGKNLKVGGPNELQHVAYWLCTCCCLCWLLQRLLGGFRSQQEAAGSCAAAAQKPGFGQRLAERFLSFSQKSESDIKRVTSPKIRQAAGSTSRSHSVLSIHSSGAAAAAADGEGEGESVDGYAESACSWEEQQQQQQQQQQQATTATLALQRMLSQQLLLAIGQYKDCVKKQLTLYTSACMLAPLASQLSGDQQQQEQQQQQQQQSPGKPPTFSLDDEEQDQQQGGGSSEQQEQQQQQQPWLLLVRHLHEAVKILRVNAVPAAATALVVEGLMAHLNVQLFNQMLLRPECCSYSNARYILAGLKELDKWFADVGPAHIGDGYAKLNHIRQAARLLLLEQKPRLCLSELLEEYCSALSAQQVYRLCTTFCDDSQLTGNFPGDVLEALKLQAHVAGNGGLIVTCLLDELPAAAAEAPLPRVSELVARCDWRVSPLAALQPPPALKAGGCPDHVWSFLQQELLL